MPTDGDVIAFDYDLLVEGHDGLYDTTMKESAEKAGLLDPNAFYAPMHYMIGSARLIAGLEEALKGLPVGNETTVELAADRAYGARDAKLIETLPMQEFRKNKVEPEVGLQINYKNRRGTVTYVGGGRIRVDFNHPLAGKKLTYKVTLRSVFKTPEERVRAIIQMDFPTSLTWDVNVDKSGVATLSVPDPVRFEQAYLMAKVRIVSDLRRLNELTSVRFVESFPLKEQEAKATTPAVKNA